MPKNELDELLVRARDQMEARRQELNRKARWHLTGIAILAVIAIALNLWVG